MAKIGYTMKEGQEAPLCQLPLRGPNITQPPVIVEY